jgi:hypothetical protein
LLNNVVGILGAAAMGCSKYLESYELLIMGRFLIGVNCGEKSSPILYVCVEEKLFLSRGTVCRKTLEIEQFII